MLRAAAAVLTVRDLAGPRGHGPVDVWRLLPRVAPELTEWAAFFAASGRRRVALERGGAGATVTTREADDLVRAGEHFLELVRAALHLPCETSLHSELTPLGHG